MEGETKYNHRVLPLLLYTKQRHKEGIEGGAGCGIVKTQIHTL